MEISYVVLAVEFEKITFPYIFSMSDNKLVKIIMDSAALTGIAAGIGWIAKKGLQRELHPLP